LDQTIEHGAMDLAADFAVPLPMSVIAEMLGVPAADWPRYRRWSDVILKLANTFARDEEAAPGGAGVRGGHGRNAGLPAGADRAAAGGTPGRPADPTGRGRGGRRAADAGGGPGLRAAPARRRPGDDRQPDQQRRPVLPREPRPARPARGGAGPAA